MTLVSPLRQRPSGGGSVGSSGDRDIEHAQRQEEGQDANDGCGTIPSPSPERRFPRRWHRFRPGVCRLRPRRHAALIHTPQGAVGGRHFLRFACLTPILDALEVRGSAIRRPAPNRRRRCNLSSPFLAGGTALSGLRLFYAVTVTGRSRACFDSVN